MFKRVVWMGVGAAAGSASTVWVQRKVRTQVDAMRATTVGAKVVGTAESAVQSARDRVVRAVGDGRVVMDERQNELRERLALDEMDDALADTAFDAATIERRPAADGPVGTRRSARATGRPTQRRGMPAGRHQRGR